MVAVFRITIRIYRGRTRRYGGKKKGKDVIRKGIDKQSYADVVRRPHNDPWRGQDQWDFI